MAGSKPSQGALEGLDHKARARVRVAGLAAALAACLIVLAIGDGARRPLHDLFQNLLPAEDVSPRIHVVVLDAESLREVGGWPWSRFYMARLVEEIADRGAVAIGLDMLLPEPDRFDPRQFSSLYGELSPGAEKEVAGLPSMDEVFAQVISRHPVVVARAGVRPGSFDFLEGATAGPPLKARFTGRPPPDLAAFPTMVTSLPRLDVAARGQGLVNGDHDADGAIRAVPLVARAGGTLTPGFALELARVAQGRAEVRLERDAVVLGSRRVPMGPDGQLRIRFGDWRKTPTVSAVNLLRRGLPGDLFKGQIVIVGLTSAGASDVAATPRARAVSGVFVQAQALDGILRGVGLLRPAWAPTAEWSAGVLLALLAWAVTLRLPVAAVGGVGAGSAVVAVGAAAAAFQAGWLIDPLPVVAPGAAASAAMLTLLYIEGRRLQARLREALEDQRASADQHQKLLINELNHRVKNTLATVQSMAAQSMRADRTPAEAREAFVSRLIALSAAQNLLTEQGWDSAEVGDIVSMALSPFDEAEGGRFAIGGPRVRLAAQHALALAMALHELAVNAVKFGALSVDAGRVQIRWRRTAEDQMAFSWEEVDGPPVQPPKRRGFGTRLIQEGLARELRGQARIEHAPAGLRFEIVFPWPRAA